MRGRDEEFLTLDLEVDETNKDCGSDCRQGDAVTLAILHLIVKTPGAEPT